MKMIALLSLLAAPACATPTQRGVAAHIRHERNSIQAEQAASAPNERASRPLTAEALERAGIACGAPDAALHVDEYHHTIVLHGDSPDRRRQIRCLFEWVRAQGYWIDQVVTERAHDAAS